MADETKEKREDTGIKIPIYAQIAGQMYEGELDSSFALAVTEGMVFHLKDNELTPVVPLKKRDEDDDLTRLAQEVVVRGYATSDPIMVGGIAEVVFETRSSKKALGTMLTSESRPLPEGRTNQWVANWNNITTLASVIKTWMGEPLGKTKEECEDRLLGMADLTVDLLLEEYGSFVRKVNRALHPKKLGPAVKKS